MWSLFKSLRFQNQIYGYQRENTGERDGLGGWDWHVHVTIHKIDHNNRWEKSIQYSMMAYMGIEPEKGWIYVYTYDWVTLLDTWH